MKKIELTENQAKQLESCVEDHMNGCYMMLHDEEDVREDFESYGAYCGCQTCDTREHLMATFDWLRSQNIVDVYVN
jgi:hypothetical protein